MKMETRKKDFLALLCILASIYLEVHTKETELTRAEYKAQQYELYLHRIATSTGTFKNYARGKSLLESLGTTFLPDT